MSDVTFPKPDLSELSRPFWDSLKQSGTLTFQRCTACNHAWLPVREECPNCLSSEWRREPSKGNGTLVSWVVYHTAFHPAFESRLPYTVAVVALDEGPRMLSNVVRTDPKSLRIDQRLRLVVEDEDGTAVPRFVPA